MVRPDRKKGDGGRSPKTPPSLLMTLLDTQTDAGQLATALRAGDDETAAALVAHLRLPPRLLTHRGLGPRGNVPLEHAADALALIAALVASSSGGKAVDVAAEAQRHRLADPEVLDLVADEVEAAAAPGHPAAHPWAVALAALDALQEPALRASALLLDARMAEGAGAADEARALVERCLALAPGLRPAVRDAAEYEMCAGHWARAWELANTIGTDPVAELLPLEADQDHLAGQISRAHAVERMLTARDEDGLTPAQAVAAGGAALERVRALIDDCEWRRQRKLEAGEEADLLPDPAELRRRVGLPPR